MDLRKNALERVPNGWPEDVFMRTACEHIKTAAGQALFGRMLAVMHLMMPIIFGVNYAFTHSFF